MGTTMTAERALGLREKAQERFEQLENEMKGGQSDPEAWEMARRAVEFYDRQAEILKVKEAEEAERQAQLKLDRERREKARTEIPRLEEKIMSAEKLRAALLDYVNILRKHGHKRLMPDPLGVFVDTLQSEIRGGADGGALDQLRWMDTPYKPNSNVIEGLRTELKTQKQILAASNGSHTKGKTA
jgi:hypothetical protein